MEDIKDLTPRELLKEHYLKRAQELISKYGYLIVVYLRVSTKNMGQEENDQKRDIFNTFDIEPKKALLVLAKESAYQQNSQANRKLSILLEVLEELDTSVPKKFYTWDLDRLNRNIEWQRELFTRTEKCSCIVISYRQKFLHQLKDSSGRFGEVMYKFLIDVYTYLAEEESRKRGDRLIKSLTLEEGKYYTNKGNRFGRKLKTLKGKAIKEERLIQIERAIYQRIQKGIPYTKIVEEARNKDIKLSMGYISNLKKKLEENGSKTL